MRVEVEGEGVLRALRAVLENAEAYDRGAEEKLARRWLKEDAEKFFREKRLAEKEERELLERREEKEEVKVVSKAGEAGPDERGILELIDSLLAEMEKP